MIIAFDGGSFKCGVTAFGAWSLVTVFLAWLCFSFAGVFADTCTGACAPPPCTGAVLSLQSCSPLCFDSDSAAQELLFLSFLGAEWMGEQGHTAGLLYSVSQPARFTRWSKISYLFRVFFTSWMNWELCKGVYGLVPYSEQWRMKKLL